MSICFLQYQKWPLGKIEIISVTKAAAAACHCVNLHMAEPKSLRCPTHPIIFFNTYMSFNFVVLQFLIGQAHVKMASVVPSLLAPLRDRKNLCETDLAFF